MPTRRHQVLLRLDEEDLDAIRHRPDYQEPSRGRVGGVAEWVRQLVHRELGRPHADPHEEQSRVRKGRPLREWMAGRCSVCGAEDPTLCGCDAPAMGSR